MEMTAAGEWSGGAMELDEFAMYVESGAGQPLGCGWLRTGMRKAPGTPETEMGPR
jgi:hypothetical protein